MGSTCFFPLSCCAKSFATKHNDRCAVPCWVYVFSKHSSDYAFRCTDSSMWILE